MSNHEKSSWIDPIETFTKTRRRLPHLQNKWAIYFTSSSTKGRQILSPEERDILFDAIKFLDGKKYELQAAVVMPDHFHLLITPLQKSDGVFSLSEIFHGIKSFTSHKIDLGTIFQDENYDHLIRNDEDYREKLIYLINNPVEAGLVERPEEYRWLYCKYDGVLLMKKY